MCACFSCCPLAAPCCWDSCCMPSCSCPTFSRRVVLQPSRAHDDYKWYERCIRQCEPYPTESERRCRSTCRRNQNIVEAMCYLFACSVPQLLCVLFRVAKQRCMPLEQFPRDRAWSVMRNVKAPYTELHDLEIYDSMYDRCGYPIDPLDPDNIFKVVRMMFLTPILSIDQQQYLMRMLQQLNEHAAYRVNLARLLETLENVDIKELACSIIDHDRHAARFYNARKCAELCALYKKVACTDKNEILRRRKLKKTSKKVQRKESKKYRKTSQNGAQAFCVRKTPDSDESLVNNDMASMQPPIRRMSDRQNQANLHVSHAARTKAERS